MYKLEVTPKGDHLILLPSGIVAAIAESYAQADELIRELNKLLTR